MEEPPYDDEDDEEDDDDDDNDDDKIDDLNILFFVDFKTMMRFDLRLIIPCAVFRRI